MAPLQNVSSSGGAEETQRCVINDEMGAFIVCYILLFITGLPGTLLSVCVFVRSHSAEPSCSVYLLNLLACDLLLLLALPFKILKDAGVASWSLMVFHYQASGVVMYVSLYASITFIALIITHRYLQGCRTNKPPCLWSWRDVWSDGAQSGGWSQPCVSFAPCKLART